MRMISDFTNRELEVVPECNDDNDNPCCWSVYICTFNSKKHFIWITKYGNNEYVIENSQGYSLIGKKTYKTLDAAKKQAETIAWIQETTKNFTD